MKKNQQHKQTIQEIFQKHGFSSVGFLAAEDAFLGNWLEGWLENGYQADMNWMKNNQEIRSNPTTIEPYVKTIIIGTYPYYTTPPDGWEKENKISNYAWGKDYHKILKKKLIQISNEIKEIIPEFEGRAFVDSAPLPEKILGQKTGLGWIGKNSLLIHPKKGSYFFLGELVTNLELDSSTPIKDYCGNCTRCITACPTDAILPNKTVDANRCISWLTIEKAGDFSIDEEKMLSYQIFGCDICQQVCPWNREAEQTQDSSFQCDPKWLDLSVPDFANMEEIQFEQLKQSSPVKRPKITGIRRNATAILNNQKQK
ncbi:MAG: epoxyqueuosine reductase [bacterium]|jgi:epoxyqueuosine reductase